MLREVSILRKSGGEVKNNQPPEAHQASN